MRTREEVQDLIDDLQGQIGELIDELDEIEQDECNDWETCCPDDVIEDDNNQRAADMNAELGAHRGSY